MISEQVPMTLEQVPMILVVVPIPLEVPITLDQREVQILLETEEVLTHLDLLEELPQDRLVELAHLDLLREAKPSTGP